MLDKFLAINTTVTAVLTEVQQYQEIHFAQAYRAIMDDVIQNVELTLIITEFPVLFSSYHSLQICGRDNKYLLMDKIESMLSFSLQL